MNILKTAQKILSGLFDFARMPDKAVDIAPKARAEYSQKFPDVTPHIGH